MKVAGYERIVTETRIVGHVGDHEGAALGDDILAKTDVARRFAHVEPVRRLEPLAVVVEQRHQRERHAIEVGDHLGHAVERLLGRSVHDAIFAKRIEAQPLGPFRLLAGSIRQLLSPAALQGRPIAEIPGPPLCHEYGPYKSILAAQQ